MLAFIIAAVSGGLLVLFLILFQIEGSAGRRVILSTFRGFLDRMVVAALEKISTMHPHIGSGAVRIAFLTFSQRIIRILLHVNIALHERLEALRRRNKVLVRTARMAREKSHLDLVSEHKAAHSLSDEDRQMLKRSALEG